MRRIVRTFFALIVISVLASCAQRDRYITITGFAQGGTYAVKLNLNGRDGKLSAEPEEIRDSIDAILGNIDNSLSGYNKKSLLSRFNAGETIVPDNLFLDIYEPAYDIYEETGGILDVASAPLFDLWGFGFTSDSLPSPEDVRRVMEVSGMGRLHESIRPLIGADGSVMPTDLVLERGGKQPELNFNAIAQGRRSPSCYRLAGESVSEDWCGALDYSSLLQQTKGASQPPVFPPDGNAGCGSLLPQNSLLVAQQLHCHRPDSRCTAQMQQKQAHRLHHPDSG